MKSVTVKFTFENQEKCYATLPPLFFVILWPYLAGEFPSVLCSSNLLYFFPYSPEGQVLAVIDVYWFFVSLW